MKSLSVGQISASRAGPFMKVPTYTMIQSGRDLNAFYFCVEHEIAKWQHGGQPSSSSMKPLCQFIELDEP